MRIGAAFMRLVRVAVSLSLIAWLVWRIGLGPVVQATIGADPRWLLAAFGALLASNVVGSYQWGRLLGLAGVRLRPRQILNFYLVGIFFNNFLPSTIGGDLSRVVDAGRATGRRAAVFGATLVDRLLGLSVIAVFATAAAVQARQTLAASALWHGVLLGTGALAVASLGGLALLLSRRLSRRVRGLGERLPGPAGRAILRLVDALEPVRATRHLVAGLLLVSLVVQVLRIMVHVLVARALDIDLELVYFFLFVPILAALVMVPISINGIGVRESMGALLFGAVGVAPAAASAMQFLAYLVAVAASMLGGVIFLLRGPAQHSAP